jgi:hypothetical protein
MNAWKVVGVLFSVLTVGQPGFAQTPSPVHVFVDGAAMTDRDPTDAFYGSDKGTAGRVAVGVDFSERHGFRFELDVPRWRVMETTFPDPVSERSTSRTAVRTLSYSFLYARRLPAAGRVQVALLAGGGIEARDYQSSGSFAELGLDGRVVQHTA